MTLREMFDNGDLVAMHSAAYYDFLREGPIYDPAQKMTLLSEGALMKPAPNGKFALVTDNITGIDWDEKVL